MLLLRGLLSISLLVLNNAGIYNKTTKGRVVRHAVNAIHAVGIMLILKGLIDSIRPGDDAPDDAPAPAPFIIEEDRDMLAQRERILRPEIRRRPRQRWAPGTRQTPEMAMY